MQYESESTLHYSFSPFYPNKLVQEAFLQGILWFSRSCKLPRSLMYPRIPGPHNMNLSETLKLLRIKEKKYASLVNFAPSLKRYRDNMDLQILRRSEAFYLPAPNIKARLKWGRVFIEEIFKFFHIADNEHGPNEPVFLVTIADKSHLTTDQPQQIQLSRIKRKIGGGLKGLSYIGMIEPGYYNVIYDELGNKRKNVKYCDQLHRIAQYPVGNDQIVSCELAGLA